MKVNNAVLPNEDQIQGFFEAGHDDPIYMVNLLRFREHAEYEDGRKTDLTGQQAYAIYGKGVTKLLKEVGGAAMFHAEVERLMLGEVEDLWDSVAIAMYPSRAAMMQMMQMPRMAEISIHRKAGLAGQLNIETVAPTGEWLARAAPGK